MKKSFQAQSTFIVVAIVLGFILNMSNCVSDDTCEPDPLYGGCSSSCEYGNFSQWISKSFGLWILLNIGSYIGFENLKKKEKLKEFLDKENLKYTVRQIDEEWKQEEKEWQKSTDKLINSMKKRS